ncbi:MAG: hypothetical protein NT018_13060, partial [Armatimonadetes bacterium]|nr:hypothetical protein [Armatimonadota bacterium]
GEIVVNYTLSSEAKKSSTNTDTDPAHKVKINIGTQGTVYGPGNAGSNVSNPWDGAIGDGEYVEGGTDGVVLDLAPAVYAEGQSANIGAFLSIGTITKSTESFIPESNETVSVSFVLSEPVRRPQATTANITSYIYDSDGRFVRLLLNEASAVDSGEVNINNQTEGHNDGANTFIWDGKDERGNIVEDGTYTITIFAKDNAGVGCESPCMTTTVDVASPEVPDPTKCEISWPEYPWPIEGQTPPAGVPGVTDSNATVYVKIGMSEEYALTPDSENGAFYVVMPETPGRYSVRLRSTGAFPEENIITVPYIVNQPSITSIADDDTIDPQGTGNVDITYNSEYGDANEKVDVSVVAAYDQSQTADSPNPVPSADKMNGGITAALTRNLSGQDGFSVATGANTYTWDRHDNNGQDLKPGLYDIIVKRRNTDGAGDMEAVVKVRVANPTGGPSISNISSHVDGPTANITWNATAASNCYVTYEVDGNPAGKLKALSTGSGSCVAWIPGAMPQTEYSYHILAVNPTTNASTISTKQTLTTRYGVQIGTSRATVKSVTETEAEVDIEYSAADFVTAAVEYAQVGPGITIQWNRAEHAYKDQEHVFKLTGLEPNSEYVYRMVSSEDKTWANSTKSEFKSFMTKIDGPSVSFVDLENGQGVSSLSTVTVRASDAHHRFSAHGITNVELYLDGEQVTVQPTKTTEASSVDYTFDMSGLNLYNGVHSVVAKAEDDFWQTSNARIDVLLYTEGAGSSTMQATALHTTTTMTAQSNQGGAGSQAVAKKYRCAACVKPGLQLVYREGKLPPGHAFLKFTHPATYISKWIGFATDSAKRFSLIFESKGYVRDEKKWEPNFIYNMYNLNDIKVTELQSLWTIILRDRANPPVFSTVPNPPGSHNCVTWIQRVIFKSGIANYDRDQFGQQAYFTMPDEMEELAEELNFEREDKIGWNRP